MISHAQNTDRITIYKDNGQLVTDLTITEWLQIKRIFRGLSKPEIEKLRRLIVNPPPKITIKKPAKMWNPQNENPKWTKLEQKYLESGWRKKEENAGN